MNVGEYIISQSKANSVKPYGFWASSFHFRARAGSWQRMDQMREAHSREAIAVTKAAERGSEFLTDESHGSASQDSAEAIFKHLSRWVPGLGCHPTKRVVLKGQMIELRTVKSRLKRDINFYPVTLPHQEALHNFFETQTLLKLTVRYRKEKWKQECWASLRVNPWETCAGQNWCTNSERFGNSI